MVGFAMYVTRTRGNWPGAAGVSEVAGVPEGFLLQQTDFLMPTLDRWGMSYGPDLGPVICVLSAGGFALERFLSKSSPVRKFYLCPGGPEKPCAQTHLFGHVDTNAPGFWLFTSISHMIHMVPTITDLWMLIRRTPCVT